MAKTVRAIYTNKYENMQTINRSETTKKQLNSKTSRIPLFRYNDKFFLNEGTFIKMKATGKYKKRYIWSAYQ